MKNAYKKYLREKSYIFAYLRFVLLPGCIFVLLVLLVFLVLLMLLVFKRSQETSFCSVLLVFKRFVYTKVLLLV